MMKVEPFSVDAVDRDLTAHEIHELLNDGKSETRTFDVTC